MRLEKMSFTIFTLHKLFLCNKIMDEMGGVWGRLQNEEKHTHTSSSMNIRSKEYI